MSNRYLPAMKWVVMILLVFGSKISFAQTTYTLNASCDTDGECNWNDGTSWVGGIAPILAIPQNGDIIVIPAGSWVEIQGSPNNTTITNAVTIQIYGTVDIRANNARLILSDAGSVIQIHEDGDILGGGNSARLSIGGTEIKGPVIDALVSPNQLTVDNIDSGGCAGAGGCDSDPLPVELTSFTSTSTSQGVELAWSTASELNNDYFSVQRSENGVDFYEIGTVQGNGTTDEMHSYSFADQNPFSSIQYYRLQQFDYDGATEIHKTIVVDLNEFNAPRNAQAYPNPTTDVVNLRFDRQTIIAELSLVDLSGKVVAQLAAKGESGMEFGSKLPQLEKGLYFIRFKTDSGEQGVRKLYIE